MYKYSARVVTCEWKASFELSSFTFIYHFYLSLLVGCHMLWFVVLVMRALFDLEFLFVIWWFNILFDYYEDYLIFPRCMFEFFFYEMHDLYGVASQTVQLSLLY